MTPAHPLPRHYSQRAIRAYARAFGVEHEVFSHPAGQQILKALIGHARSDEQAATLAGLTLEQLHHDCTTLSATDSLPLIIVSTTPGTPGFFYFSRPLRGWPQPNT